MPLSLPCTHSGHWQGVRGAWGYIRSFWVQPLPSICTRLRHTLLTGPTPDRAKGGRFSGISSGAAGRRGSKAGAAARCSLVAVKLAKSFAPSRVWATASGSTRPLVGEHDFFSGGSAPSVLSGSRRCVLCLAGRGGGEREERRGEEAAFSLRLQAAQQHISRQKGQSQPCSFRKVGMS